MSADQRESRLIALARQGNMEAYGDLYELFLEELYRYVFYRVGNKEDAEDLTEKVFLKAWDALPSLRTRVSFRAWIYRIAQNTIIDHHRTRKETLPLAVDNVLVNDDEQPEAQTLARERSAQLVDILSELSSPHQEVLILRFVNGYSTAETAQFLNRSVGAVRVLQHRALKEMRSYLVAEEKGNG